MPNWSNYSDAWKNADTAGQYRLPPDGKYNFMVDGAVGTQTQGGTQCIEWQLTAIIPGEEPMSVRKTNFLGERSFPMLKRDIKALGVDPDIIDLVYMDAWLSYFQGFIVCGEVTTSEKDGKTYRNINFLELVSRPDKPEPEQTGFVRVEEEEEEVPF